MVGSASEGAALKIASGIGIITVLVCGGCSQPPMNHSISWESQLGQRVTVEGIAANAKLGAMLRMSHDQIIWIDGLETWPSGLYRRGQAGIRLRVSGTVIKRSDRPVFIEEPSDLPRAGIPMPKGTDLEKAAIRYLLQDATWEAVEGSE